MADRRQTLFSEYQSIDNDSITSRQLEYWLKQMGSHPKQKSGFDWTLMSQSLASGETSPSIQRDGEPSNKENNMANSISTKPFEVPLSSKSYVSAMRALQQKNKELQGQNEKMKLALRESSQQRSLLSSESSEAMQNLQKRMQIMEPKMRKLDELTQQHKRLREQNEQNVTRIRLLTRNNQELTGRTEQLYQQSNQLTQTNASLTTECQTKNEKIRNVSLALEEAQARNKILEQMKEKSQIGIMNKYAKCLESVEAMTIEIQVLKRQLEQSKQTEQKQREQQIRCMSTIKELQGQIINLKQEGQAKQHSTEELKKQCKYLKDQLQSTTSELMATLKSIPTLRAQIISEQLAFAQAHSSIARSKEENDRQNERQTQRMPHVACERIEEKRMVSLESPEVESRLIGESAQPRQDREYCGSTKSVSYSKNSSIIDIAERQIIDPKAVVFKKHRSQQKSKADTTTVKISNKSRDKSGDKSDDKSGDKSRNKSGDKSGIKSGIKSFKVKKSQDKKSNSSQKSRSEKQEVGKNKLTSKKNIQHSFIMKSCQPLACPLHTPQQEFYTSWGETRRLGCQQQQNEACLTKALLLDVQKQAIRLYEQQQNLLKKSSQQCKQMERAEYLGRLKQLNEQIRINSDKMMQLKSL